jgi:hypothetical protein
MIGSPLEKEGVKEKNVKRNAPDRGVNTVIETGPQKKEALPLATLFPGRRPFARRKTPPWGQDLFLNTRFSALPLKPPFETEPNQ